MHLQFRGRCGEGWVPAELLIGRVRDNLLGVHVLVHPVLPQVAPEAASLLTPPRHLTKARLAAVDPRAGPVYVCTHTFFAQLNGSTEGNARLFIGREKVKTDQLRSNCGVNRCPCSHARDVHSHDTYSPLDAMLEKRGRKTR